MKVKINDDGKKTFKPIVLEIVLESPEEAAILYCVLNHSAICDAAKPMLSLCQIREKLNGVRSESPFNYNEYFKQFKTDLVLGVKKYSE